LKKKLKKPKPKQVVLTVVGMPFLTNFWDNLIMENAVTTENMY